MIPPALPEVGQLALQSVLHQLKTSTEDEQEEDIADDQCLEGGSEGGSEGGRKGGREGYTDTHPSPHILYIYHRVGRLYK